MFSPPEQRRPSDADKKQLLKYIQLVSKSDSLDATSKKKGQLSQSVSLKIFIFVTKLTKNGIVRFKKNNLIMCQFSASY